MSIITIVAEVSSSLGSERNHFYCPVTHSQTPNRIQLLHWTVIWWLPSTVTYWRLAYLKSSTTVRRAHRQFLSQPNYWSVIEIDKGGIQVCEKSPLICSGQLIMLLRRPRTSYSNEAENVTMCNWKEDTWWACLCANQRLTELRPRKWPDIWIYLLTKLNNVLSAYGVTEWKTHPLSTTTSDSMPMLMTRDYV